MERLERELARYCGLRYAIGVASGTDALHLALRACGVGTGDEVITSAFSFVASASSIVLVGASPVFADIDESTFNVGPEAVRRALSPRTKAIIAVHLFGQPADMVPILDLAKPRGIWVIEDAAQAIGAEYRGQRVGSLGNLGCFSFFPSKNLGGAGDGGLVTTNDAALADRVRALRQHGALMRYQHEEIGLNSRLDELQAAILLAKLPHLERWTEQRGQNAGRYNELLAHLPVVLPKETPGVRAVYNQYTIRVPEHRDALAKFLAERSIGTGVYYPTPLHLQPAFRYLGYRYGDLPASEAAAAEVLSLPVFPELTEAEIVEVAATIREFFEQL